MMLATTSRKATRRAAFTLLEVLVVVAILVILAGIGVVATTRYLEDAKKSKAQMQCVALAQACEAYKLNPGSNGEYPTNLTELVNPPFGSSFLKNGMNDLNSPWTVNGQAMQFQYQIMQSQSDQTQSSGFPYVSVTAPDGTLISNFGIGPKATPTQ